MIKENDCILINYNAWNKENKQLFDTTNIEVAKKNGIFNEKANYGPIKIIVNKGFVIKGLDSSLIDKKVKDKYTIEIPFKDGFGKWNSNLTENIKISSFKDQNIMPQKGMIIEAEGRTGRVMFVSKGRFVKVDFNHPFANKDLIYDVEIVEILKGDEEKVSALLDYFIGKPNYELKMDEKNITIKTKMVLPKELIDFIKANVKDIIKKNFKFDFKVDAK